MPGDLGPVVPDPDDFDRMLRDLTSGKAEPARFRELSAEERARRAALPAAPQRTSWHGGRKARKPRRAASGPGRVRPASGSSRRIAATGYGRPPVAAGGERLTRRSAARAVAVLIGFCVFVYGLHLLGFGPKTTGGASPSAGQHTKAPAKSRPASRRLSAARAVPAFTTADPFAGSPADQFQDGAAGIVPPGASSVAGYTKAQVAQAYAVTRRLLIAGQLDPATLNGGVPRAFSALLTPQQRTQFLRGLVPRGLGQGGAARSTRTWVTSFAPGTTAFVGNAVKVHGLMRAVATRLSGRSVLGIEFNYLFVYPVQRPGLPATRLRVVVHVRGSADFARWDRAGPAALQAWWLPTGTSTAGALCGATDGFVHPDFPAGAASGVLPAGQQVNPYELNPPPSQARCQPAAGT